MKTFTQKVTYVRTITVRADSAEQANRKLDEVVESDEFCLGGDGRLDSAIVWDEDHGE